MRYIVKHCYMHLDHIIKISILLTNLYVFPEVKLGEVKEFVSWFLSGELELS